MSSFGFTLCKPILGQDNLFLENVDRLLCFPKVRPGGDFAVILGSLAELEYAVEWRVINAADYGMPQRRRRLFIFAHHRSSPGYKNLKPGHVRMTHSGIFPESHPVAGRTVSWDFDLSNFGDMTAEGRRPFGNAGFLLGGRVFAARVRPRFDGHAVTLADVLMPESEVPERFFIPTELEGLWRMRKSRADGTRAVRLTFPDPVDRPSRTVITSEGQPGPCRDTHVIRTDTGRLRRLMPVELERLNAFPDGHTAGHSDARRGFLMGNALVVTVVERLARAFLRPGG